VQRVDQGAIRIDDSVAMQTTVSGRELRDGFGAGMRALTFGLIRMRDDALRLGPLELLRFGRPELLPFAVEWQIEGGLLTRRPGGRFRIAAGGGRLVASVQGYCPALPLPLYAVTQLPVHHLVTRLHLLRVRGREPAPGIAVPGRVRLQAAAIDIALCAAVAALAGRRRRLRVLLGIAAAYHVTCWAAGGRTIGGSFMRQRVVAVDGSAVSAGQAVVRLLALPVAWARRRPVHDELSGTEVVVD
jgi:hypothetical protein